MGLLNIENETTEESRDNTVSIPELTSQPKVSKTAVFKKCIPWQILGSCLSTSYPGRQEQKYNILVLLQNC